MERFYYQKKKRKVMGLRKKKVGTKSFDFQIGILIFYEHKVNNDDSARMKQACMTLNKF